MTREMFCLMEGRHVHPSTLYPGGVGTVPTRAALHRLPRPADEVRRVHEEGRAAARRPVRLLLRGAARLRGGRPAARPARLLGLVQRPRRLRLHLPEHDRVGPGDVRHARRRRRRQAGHHRPGRHQPRHPHPARQLVLRRLGGRRDVRQARTRWATRSTSGTPGTRRRRPRPQKRDFDGKYTWVMSPRWLDKRTGDHLALDTGGGPLARLWATALAGLVDIGYVKATGHSVKIYLPKTAMLPEVEFEWKIPQVEQHHRARPRPDLLPGLRRGGGPLLRRAGAEGAARRPDRRPGPTSRCPTRRSAAASTRRCAACCRTTS